MIWGINVEGSALESGTIRDMAHYRGRFASEISTVLDIESQRGRFGPGEWNRPRYGALSWKVQPLDPEPSVICVFIAEGWLCLHRTVHEIGPKRGGFASGY